MFHHTKLDENLEGGDDFQEWKYRISLVLEENELDSYINEEVPVPEGDEAKALHKNKLVMDKRIIADSIKDHLIPQVSSLKTPKAMFDALTKLFEGKNINQKMTLRNQLKNVKIHSRRLWEECSQEEARIAAQEEKMGSEDQALTVHSKKSKRSSHRLKGKHFHKDNTRKYLSRIRCYTCDEK